MSQSNYVGYIYKFTLIPTQKIYVGKRQKSVFDEGYFGSGPTWVEAKSCYTNDDIKREVLEWCTSVEELCAREIYGIDILDARNPEVGYNKALGGDLGSTGCTGIASEQQRLNISKALRGKKHSDSARKNMSVGQKRLGESDPNHAEVALKGGRNYHEDNPDSYKTRSIRIKCIELDKEYESIDAAQKDLGIGHISDCINGIIDTAGGYHGEKIGGCNSTFDYSDRKKKVKCIETNVIYNSIKEAEISMKCSHVGAVCEGIRKTAGGYHGEGVN